MFSSDVKNGQTQKCFVRVHGDAHLVTDGNRGGDRPGDPLAGASGTVPSVGLLTSGQLASPERVMPGREQDQDGIHGVL